MQEKTFDKSKDSGSRAMANSYLPLREVTSQRDDIPEPSYVEHLYCGKLLVAEVSIGR